MINKPSGHGFTLIVVCALSNQPRGFSAKAVGRRACSSRFDSRTKPNVAYLVLNFCALWKKQTTLPSLAYAGILDQRLGEMGGALALMMPNCRDARTPLAA